MRHGDAPFIDGERALSPLGDKQTQAMAKWLQSECHSSNQPLARILVSPLLRAQQTADWLEERFKALSKEPFEREIEPLLLPETDASLTAEYLKSLNLESLLVISHMPLVSNLLAYFEPKASRYFAASSIATLHLNDALEVTKVDFLSPEQL